MKPLAIFLHIPKTAGSSLSACFNLNFAPSQQLYLDAGVMQLPPHSPESAARWDEKIIREYCEQNAKNIRYAHGHLAFYGVHHWLGEEYAPQYFTFLREPVARVISLYRYVKGQSEHDWNREISENNWTLENWARQSAWLKKRDGQTRRILLGSEDRSTHGAALHAPQLETAHLKIAKARLREFWFVGLTETFHDDAHFLYGQFGFRHFARDLVVNANRGNEQISSATRDLIAQQSPLDWQLYDFARPLHSQFLKQHFRSFHAHRLRAISLRRAKQALRPLRRKP